MAGMTPPSTLTEFPADWQVPDFRVEFSRDRLRRHAVVIPVINEGARITRQLERMAAIRVAEIADILIVDGGSSDGSLDHDALRALGVSTLLTKTGPGKLSAQLRCAYAHVLVMGYGGIVTIDGNDKDDPRAIPRFIETLESGVDFVQASRFISGGIAENTPWLRELAIRLIHAPMTRWASGFPWTDTTQGFRAYSRALLLDPRVAPFREVFQSYELLAYLSCRAPRLGFRCVELPTTRRYPKGEVPTKISHVRGNAKVLEILIKACRGGYDPPSQKED